MPPMTRVARLGLMMVALSGASVFAGCGTDTTLDPGADSGIQLPDGSNGRDSAIVPLGDTGTTPPIDGGMVTPFDTGPFMRPDGGRFMRPDSGTAMGGSDSGTTMGIMCGTEVCTGTQTCCITRGGGGMMLSEACAAPGTCMGGATLTCDGPEDCASGQSCCGALTGGAAGAMCAAGTCMGGAPLCHTTADCPMGSMCCSFMGLSVCSRFGCP